MKLTFPPFRLLPLGVEPLCFTHTSLTRNQSFRGFCPCLSFTDVSAPDCGGRTHKGLFQVSDAVKPESVEGNLHQLLRQVVRPPRGADARGRATGPRAESKGLEERRGTCDP